MLRLLSEFGIRKFHELWTTVSVQKALSRLAQEGVVERVTKGICVRPKTLVSMPSIKITASAEQIAKKWAQQHGYTLVRQGIYSAYRLDLHQGLLPDEQKAFHKSGPGSYRAL
ncbi:MULTISPECIES: DUF6088 family protein [unclassified Marinobacter]|uniref:DUF6088 family protein n=1 Tax=unclassified Marinobacter TaxID=83889 RepID=UPI001E31E0A0|nr:MULTISPECIES: DUF6088 family protein [unclassified Marinobacter]